MGATNCCNGPTSTIIEQKEDTPRENFKRNVGFKQTIEKIGDGEPITKEKLKELLVGDEAGGKKQRQATGYINKSKLKAMLAEDDDEDEEEDEDDDVSHSGGGKSAAGRKGTGYVTKNMLASMMEDFSEEEEEEDTQSKGSAREGKKVQIAVPEEVVTKVLDQQDSKCKERQGTGYVTKKLLKQMLNEMGDEDDDGDGIDSGLGKVQANVGSAGQPANSKNGAGGKKKIGFS